MVTVEIPIGARVEVERTDGNTDLYVFRGTDERGAIFEGTDGCRQTELGLYRKLIVHNPD